MPTHGFLLLPPSPVPGYRGVDRNGIGVWAERPPTAPRDYQWSPFAPLLLEGEMDPSYMPKKGDDAIWAFYPPGWGRDAYRLYEGNWVVDGEWLPDLLSSPPCADLIYVSFLPEGRFA
jgi:hypothetical protein